MRLLLEHALIDGTILPDVAVTIADGRFAEVVPGGSGGTRLPGVSVPGLANCHSHAFHRALRGRTQAERGTFWTWREQMYDVAARLDPESYYALARATYREMVAAGITAVGEFHYLHHGPGGTAYDDPNAMGRALIAAARDVGLRITLLDTCYLASGFGTGPEGVQLRYSDGTADAWAARVADLRAAEHDDPRGAGGPGGVVVGAAIHSVRAVPADQLATVAEAAGDAPLHVHLSEQPAENQASLAATGMTPTRLLAEHGALTERTSAVHATHLSDGDIALLGQARSSVCFCPTTERDLADGVGPSRALAAAGARLTLGSDSHAVIDPFEEMRAVELDERLVSGIRGHWSAAELLRAGTADGHRSLGFADAGAIAVGQRADLVTLDPDSPRTAGVDWTRGPGGPERIVFAASPADVTQVVADGAVVFTAADRAEIGRELSAAIRIASGS